ncbi:MAG: sigma-70 family RNA polymerase sigma factor [Clostridia bacterium]|nr:sigma-70 family RNA polymerase sigma factor [Clostridia bacterium]
MDPETVFKKYSKQIYVTALSCLKNPWEAENVMQDVFVKLLSLKKDFESEEHLRRWLIKVAVNLCRNVFRSPWFSPSVPVEDCFKLQGEHDADPALLDVRNAVMKLDKNLRLPVVLYYYDGFDVKQCAQILGVSEGALKARLFRAREKLKSMLGDDYDY